MNNLKNKKKALNYFKKNILDSAKDDVMKIYLFGSMAQEKKARKDSDIDLVIFSRKKKDRRLENAIDEKAFETVVKYGESIEPLIYPIENFKYPHSAFLKKIIQDGKELYSKV